MDLKDMGIEEKQKVDIYRDTPLRYLGYANELGEAFRAQIGTKWVTASYGVAMAYVIADTIDKARSQFETWKADPSVIKKTAFAAADCLVWQTLASVALPGLAINRTCAVSAYLLRRNAGGLKASRRAWLVTAVGLVTIPFIIRPIDRFTDRLLDGTLRKLEPE